MATKKAARSKKTTTKKPAPKTTANAKKKIVSKKKASARSAAVAHKAAKRAAPPRATQASARSFVQRVLLPPVTRTRALRSPPPPINFDELKQQAAVVGSSVVSFDQGVMPETRDDICNATLLAQLVATKKVPDTENVFGWFDEYVKTLMRVGWVVQESGFEVYREEMTGLETHEAILKVASLFLGAAPSALALITSTLQAMQSMDQDNPWITIFNRETKHAKTGHFQISLAQQDSTGKLLISMLAFTLEANSELTQILFFKLWKNQATFKHNSVRATINRSVLASVRELLKKKLSEQVSEFIAAVEI